MDKFSLELRRRIKAINDKADTPICELKTKSIECTHIGPLYHIYKRSVPVAINQPILFNLSSDEADNVLKSLKAKRYNDVDGTYHVIFYEKLNVDTDNNDVYYRAGPLTKETGLEIVTNSERFEVPYID